jgi:Leucine-rich repeat (LRR) protein
MSLPAIAIPEPTPIAKDAIELIEKIGGKYELSTTGDLKSLSISGDKIAVEMFDTFAKQIELTTLKITNFPNFNDDTLQKLTGLKKITNLTITHSAITDVSVETIVKSFPLISVLDLSRNFSLTDKSIAEISKLSELETLILVYCSFSDSQLSTLATLPKLRALDIRGNMSISNKGLESVAGIPKLRSLKHLSPAIDDGGVKALAAAKNLETLDVQDFTISDLAGEVLKNFPKLSSLIIYRCTNFGSNGLLSLQGKPLKRLTLRDLPAIDDDGLIAFRELSTLKRLYLQELDSVSDGGLRNLIYLKELETLEIRNMTLITDKTVESISRLSNLKSISISGTQITDKSIELLLSLQKLKELTLKNNSLITDDAKKKLKDSKKFAILNLE